MCKGAIKSTLINAVLIEAAEVKKRETSTCFLGQVKGGGEENLTNRTLQDFFEDILSSRGEDLGVEGKNDMHPLRFSDSVSQIVKPRSFTE